MRLKKAFFCFTFAIASAAQAQFTYVLDQSIPVEYNGVTLPMPWAGAFNSPQFNTMDLNGDNIQDLVIFDRRSDHGSCVHDASSAAARAPTCTPRGIVLVPATVTA